MGKEVLVIIGAVLACNGFWTFITSTLDKKRKKRTPLENGVIAILHSTLFSKGKCYILRGSITTDELEDLTEMYNSYHNLGGNGTGTKIYNDCCKLPLCDEPINERKLP